MERERRRKKQVALLCLGAALGVTGLIFWFVGRPMLQFVSQPELFRDWVDGHGAGYAFGVLEGTALCLLATTLASGVIFLIVKKYGMKFVTLFVAEEKIRSLKFLQNARRLEFIVFLLFFIPGTPKDVLTYMVGLTPMKLRVWLLITTVARIPSVVTSTIGGDALGTQEYLFAVIVFVATAAVSGLGVLLYRAIRCRHQRREQGERDV